MKDLIFLITALVLGYTFTLGMHHVWLWWPFVTLFIIWLVEEIRAKRS